MITDKIAVSNLAEDINRVQDRYKILGFELTSSEPLSACAKVRIREDSILEIHLFASEAENGYLRTRMFVPFECAYLIDEYLGEEIRAVIGLLWAEFAKGKIELMRAGDPTSRTFFHSYTDEDSREKILSDLEGTAKLV